MEIIGHRGNQEKYVENSYDAIIDCSNNENIDGTEFDIRPTKDGNIVVIHNPKINGERIIDLTTQEIKQMNFQTMKIDQLVQRIRNLKKGDKYFKDIYAQRGKETSKIPTLEEILKDYDKSKHMLIELKGQKGEYSDIEQEQYERKLIELLKQYDYKNRNIALEGYNLEALLRIKNQLPDLKIIALINKNGNLNNISNDFDGASIEHVIITIRLIERIMKENLKLYSWDDKTPIKHYEHINIIKTIFQKELNNNQLDMAIINDFPEEARKRTR